MAKASRKGEGVSVLALSRDQRMKIARELGVEDGLKKIPDRIIITRVSHAAAGLTAAAARGHKWILVDA